MSELAYLVDEIKTLESGEPWHGPSLAEILSDLTAAEAEARPLAGGHSIRELVLHVAGWQEVVCLRLEGQDLQEPPDGDFPSSLPPGEPGWEAAKAKLSDAQRRLLASISRLSDRSLDTGVAGKRYTVRVMLKGAVCHLVYHAGQISLLKRALRKP